MERMLDPKTFGSTHPAFQHRLFFARRSLEKAISEAPQSLL